jgi:hypothetical protein
MYDRIARVKNLRCGSVVDDVDTSLLAFEGWRLSEGDLEVDAFHSLTSGADAIHGVDVGTATFTGRRTQALQNS